MLDKDVPENAFDPILAKPDGNVMLDKCEQFWNTFDPILVNPDGNVILDKCEQFINALSTSVVIPEPSK